MHDDVQREINRMMENRKHRPVITLDEMMDCLRNPKNKRSLAELDDVISEILERNPDFVKQIERIINERTNSRTI